MDDETIKLLIETTVAINKLQIDSKFRETLDEDENKYTIDLNNEIFDCRRYIICRICHVSTFINLLLFVFLK